MAPTTWSDRLDHATRLGVGAVARLLPLDTAPGARFVADAGIGMLVQAQRTATAVVRGGVAAGTALASRPIAGWPLRTAATGARRALAPLAVQGAVAREKGTAEAATEVPALVARAVDTVLDLVSLDDVLARVDIDELLNRIDVDGVVERVAVDAVVERINLDALLARVDLQQLLARIDVNTVVAEIDVDSLVERTDLGAVIAQSTGGMASGAVDLVRRQGVGLDSVVASWAARLRHRALRDAPSGPPLLADGPGTA